jgi:hypothetical protein
VDGILRVAIRCAITPISPLVAEVLQLGAASLEPLGNNANGGPSHVVFKPKLNPHIMCAQESSLHTYRIKMDTK